MRSAKEASRACRKSGHLYYLSYGDRDNDEVLCVDCADAYARAEVARLRGIVEKQDAAVLAYDAVKHDARANAELVGKQTAKLASALADKQEALARVAVLRTFVHAVATRSSHTLTEEEGHVSDCLTCAASHLLKSLPAKTRAYARECMKSDQRWERLRQEMPCDPHDPCADDNTCKQHKLIAALRDLPGEPS